MFATLSTAWVLPGVIGPAIAGLVGETLGWRFVFLGLLPLIVLAALISYPALRRIGAPETAATAEAAAAASFRRRLPLALLVAAGTGLFLAGLTSGQTVATIVLRSTSRPAFSTRSWSNANDFGRKRSSTPPSASRAPRARSKVKRPKS